MNIKNAILFKDIIYRNNIAFLIFYYVSFYLLSSIKKR